MLDEMQILSFRARAEEIAKPITEYLLKEIARRVSEAGELTSTAAYELYKAEQLGAGKKEMKRELKKLLKTADEEIDAFFTKGAELGYAFDVSRFSGQAVKTAAPLAENRSLRQMAEAAAKTAKEDFTNLTDTLGMVAPDGKPYPLQKAYQKSMDFAFEQVFTGAADYNTAIREAVKNLADKGIRTIDYRSGIHTGLEAAVRRNIMGGLGKMQTAISEKNHDELGADGWEISAHAASAPDHEPIQGKQYTDAEYKKLNESLHRHIGELNCGHAAFPVLLGVNEPQYTPQELEKMQKQNAEGITYEGRHYTMYEATQQQRRLETAIRRQKNRVLTARQVKNHDWEEEASGKLQRLQQEYTKFSKAAGLPPLEEQMETVKNPPQAKDFIESAKKKYSSGMTMSASSGKLDADDEEAIYEYMTSGVAYSLNESLRSGAPLTERQEAIKRNLDIALSKLPDYEGVVYRSLSSEFMDVNDFFNRHEVDGLVRYDAFTSTSKKVYDETMDIQLVLKVKHGKDISQWNENEAEVLLRRGTYFYVTKVEGKTIYLEEI